MYLPRNIQSVQVYHTGAEIYDFDLKMDQNLEIDLTLIMNSDSKNGLNTKNVPKWIKIQMIEQLPENELYLEMDENPKYG